MRGPKTKNWSALENKHEPSGLHVIVSGLVELEPDQAPVLTERTGRAQVLELELTIGTSSDPDFHGLVWKQASFHKEVNANQYNSVRVMSDDFVVADFPVLDDREHDQLKDKQTAAQNAAAGKATSAKKKKSTAAKVVNKAVEAVKDAVDTVKKAAKTIARNVTKKAAKKAVKKSGKKSARKGAEKALRGPTKTYARKGAKKSAKTSAKKAKAARRPVRKAKRR